MLSNETPSKNDILTILYKSKFIDDLVYKITSGHQLGEDLKSELFLILVEMSDVRIKRAHDNNYLNYLCVNILKKQYHSNTSPFHKLYRKNSASQVPIFNDDDKLEDIINSDDVNEMEDILNKIEWIVENKLSLIDRELFKLYYKMGRYNRTDGDLRDITCNKATSSYRKIEKKLAITTLDKAGHISICRSTIALSHKRSMDKIKKWLSKI
jgi:hypothetical protein